MTATSDLAITAERIDRDGFTIETTERVDLINRAQATYYRRWSDYEGNATADALFTVRDADSVGIQHYGILYNDSIALPYITAEDQAQDVISWLVSDRADTRYVVRFSGGPWLQQVEIGDVINFDPTGSDGLAAALLGLITSSDLFRVINTNRPSDGTVEVVAVQIRVPSKLLLESGDDALLEDGGGIEL